MKHTMISVRDLTTYDQCAAALDAIEGDYNNYQGGLSRWLSGYQTTLTAGAKKKVEAITRKMDKLTDGYDE